MFQPVDFDSLPNPFFNLTIYVQDIDANHVDTAYIEVQVTDFNDNAPMFIPNSKKVSIFENVTIGTTLHKFTATDKDTGINQQFRQVLINFIHAIYWKQDDSGTSVAPIFSNFKLLSGARIF